MDPSTMNQVEMPPTRVQKKWTKDEDEHLRRLINQFGDQNWKTIAEYFPERTFEQCRQRWRYTLNPENIKERWTNHEDKVLIDKYREVGNKWAKIAAFLPGRTNKKVRDRWRTLNSKSGTDLAATNPYHVTAGTVAGGNSFDQTQFRQAGGVPGIHPQQTHYSTMNKKSNVPRRVHNKWSKDEDEKLRNLIAQFGDQNWKTIAEYFPERTFEQCRQRWRYTLSEAENIKQGWSKQEDKILLEKCCEFGNKWAKIAKFLPGRTNKKVRDRWRSLNSKTIPTANGRVPHAKGSRSQIPPGAKNVAGAVPGPTGEVANNKKWSTEEDVKLRWLVAQYGDSKWKAIASYFPEKTFEQCRQRWRNTLNPDINKKPWTNEEDKILLSKYGEFGNQFAKIAKFLSGRTNIGCRDRWRTLSGKTSTKPRNPGNAEDPKHTSSLESILKVMKSPTAPKKGKAGATVPVTAAAITAQSVSIIPAQAVKYADHTAPHYQNYLAQGTSLQQWQSPTAVSNCFMYGSAPTYR